MDNSITQHERFMAAVIHLSTFTKYLIPFGNFIFPLLLWICNKDKLTFVDANGKQAINFQISILLYCTILGIIALPITLITGWEFISFTNLWQPNSYELDFNFNHLPNLGISALILGILGLLGVILLLIDILCSIIATLKAKEGDLYKYPISIAFIK